MYKVVLKCIERRIIVYQSVKQQSYTTEGKYLSFSSIFLVFLIIITMIAFPHVCYCVHTRVFDNLIWAPYLALHSSLFGPDDTVNYDYIITNSINTLLIGSIPNSAHIHHC